MAGFIYAALGVIYAVLLALVVISVWEEYQAASETVEQEANATAEIFWLGYQLPEPEGTHIQELARSYAEEQSNFRAGEFVAENLAHLLANPPQVTAGEVDAYKVG